MQELRTFGYDLCDGHLQLAVQLVENFITDNQSGNEEYKSLAETHLKKLQAGLAEAQGILEKSVGEDGQVNRWYYTITGERELKRSLKNLREWQYDFTVFIILAEKTRQSSPQDMLLTQQRLRITTQNMDGFLGLHVESAPHVCLATAEYKDETGQILEIDVLIEEQNTEDTTALMANHLKEEFTTSGILQCLGYRADPMLELIFRIPSNFMNPKSLKRLIAEGNHDTITNKPTNRLRISLAMALSEAVLSVHAARLVHKSIQPETILIFENWNENKTHCDSDTSLGVPVLIGWTMARKMDELSSRLGEDDWIKNIYRHPQRQGLQLEKRYHMGHDLYSLGVCLLELGLWEPLIVRQGNQPMTMSGRYHEMVLKLQCINSREVDVLKRLVKPATVQKVMVGMADHDLDHEMGRGYSQVVLACFEHAEALGQLDKLGENDSDVPMMYSRLILKPLSELLLPVMQTPIDS